MKILLISRAGSPRGGGMEWFSRQLIRAASKDTDLEAHPLIYRGARRYAPLFVLGVIPKALIKARQCDIVHLGDPVLSLVGWLIKKILGKKVVITVHGLDVLYPNPIYQAYLWLFSRDFDLYLPISAAVRKELARRAIKGRQVVISPAAPNDYFDPRIKRTRLVKLLTDKARGQFTSADNHIFLLTVGRLVKRKGHAWYIANVLQYLPDNVHYVIAGDGPEKNHIRKIVQATRLKARVHLLGRVRTRTLRVLYNTTDIFIQPNIKVKGDMEGFGLVLLEAALCNRPVLAAKLEGITDAITGQAGTLVPSGDSAAWIEATKNVVHSLGRQNESRTDVLNKYSWNNYLLKFKAAVVELV